MEIGQSSKVYGLSFPTRQQKKEPRQLIESVFKDESDDEQEKPEFKSLESNRNRVYQAKINRKTKSDLEKALEEDPSIFQYDEILDDIHTKKGKDVSNLFSQAPKESKYVGKLVKSANERKLERELCAERKAQKEIESEADMFKDKESFVTSAYKQKLGELRELVEKRKEEENRERIMDITKQDGLGGFYRYMFEQETDLETNAKTTEKVGGLSAEKHRHTFKNPGLPEQKKHHTHNSTSDSKRKHERTESASNQSTMCIDQKDESSQHGHLPSGNMSSDTTESIKKKPLDIKVSSKESREPGISSDKVTKKIDYGPGFIAARPRVTTDEELEAARQRYLARKAAGIHALIVESD